MKNKLLQFQGSDCLKMVDRQESISQSDISAKPGDVEKRDL